MSLLPQHKKSPEELAKLRESLGIPGQPPVSEPSPVFSPPIQAGRELPIAKAPLDPGPAKVESGPVSTVLNVLESPTLAALPVAESPPKQVRSLRRSDRNPVSSPGHELPRGAEHESSSVPPASAVSVASSSRAVHSLRKSEQLPLSQIRTPAPDSSLPIHRHSPEEIREIRRQEVLAMQKVAGEQVSHKAHWIIVIPGYLFALAALGCCYYYQLGIQITASCLLVSFLVAGFLLIRKPYSRHHAAFIGVMSLLIAIFSILYYFPQLRYGA